METLLVLLMNVFINGDLVGEVMNISEWNPGINLENLHLMECPEGQDCKVGNLNREPTCVERRQLIGLDSNKSDKYVVVPAETGRKLQLDCHYCHERDEAVPKVWYYYERFLASKRFKPVPLHLEYPPESRKFIVDEDSHRLTIKNFEEADGALYFCQGLDDDSPKFNYLVDAVGDSSDIEPERGNWNDYLYYHKEIMEPLNKKLQDEYKNDLKNWFATKLKIHNYNVSHKWSLFGKCHSCGRAHGVRIRIGQCQLSIPTLSSQSGKRGSGAMNLGYTFSCQSTMLKRFLTPKMRNRVKNVVNFVEELPCYSKCNIPGLESGNMSEIIDLSELHNIEHEPPTFLNVVGTIGEPLTLLCSDDPAADIVWLKDIAMLILPETSERGKRAMTYTRGRGGIRFLALNTSDEGSYTCIFNDVIKMIFKLETQEPLGDPPIPEMWIWIHLGGFSVFCFIIWIVMVICISRVSQRTRAGYQLLSNAEEILIKKKRALKEGREEGQLIEEI